MQNILIYGGSFDPPHNGHLLTALAVQNKFKFDEFLFLPCKSPVLKAETLASPAQRVEMLELALLPYSEFQVDCREINRNTPSYMVETLLSFRQETAHLKSLTLLLGMDAFLSLPNWHEWRMILKLCNLLVMKRSLSDNECIPEVLVELLSIHQRFNREDFFKQAYGSIYFLDAGHYEISSTCIRKMIRQGKNIESLVSKSVYQYIEKWKLYRDEKKPGNSHMIEYKG